MSIHQRCWWTGPCMYREQTGDNNLHKSIPKPETVSLSYSKTKNKGIRINTYSINFKSNDVVSYLEQMGLIQHTQRFPSPVPICGDGIIAFDNKDTAIVPPINWTESRNVSIEVYSWPFSILLPHCIPRRIYCVHGQRLVLKCFSGSMCCSIMDCIWYLSE